MEEQIRYANENHSTCIREKNGVTYLTFPLLERAGLIHGFTTRLGGVSTGDCASMNLSFTRGDREEDVRENYKRIGQALGIDMSKAVLSHQVHKTEIFVAGKEDQGRGVDPSQERLFEIDGLMTKEEGIPLVTFFADCVPLLFYDPKKKVIASSHSGWRGTVEKIGAKTVKKMEQEFGCKPEDILAVIGPSICQDCYEVSEDVAKEFEKVFTREEYEEMILDKKNGKYQLDLWKANEYILLGSGIRKEHLAVTDLCTCCNPEFLFSHRASHGRRGNLSAILCLVKEG
ncbi:MAG: peptidoglycan editing factor PgeF [Lachnospiraceae bacterium]|nr:peptidoglycan editing factor PgeF [Lachnospiraceae bacterium]